MSPHRIVLGYLPHSTRLILLLFGLLFSTGCAEYQVTIPDSHVEDINYRGGTMKALFWGKWNDPEVLAADCATEGINDVVVKRTYLHDLISVFTFGIVMPIEVTFRCESGGLIEGDESDFDIPDRTP
ncbi:MAG: hypothetical protein D6690_16010 [Nitrospirae bacterium]|nr:MAG: hypothetical protein D6690_16010 [Nitrospirota bacterium]